MKILLVTIVIAFFSSCGGSESFVNSTLKAEKAGDCSQRTGKFNMSSNINGERYEFDYCLPDNFDEKNFSVTRKGDTLELQLSQAYSNEKTALYNLTLDIDANPRYNHIKLGEQVFDVVPAGN